MISLRRQVILTTLKIYDVAAMVFSFLLGASAVSYLAGEVFFARFLSMRIRVQNFAIFLIFMLAWHVILTAFGLYQSKGAPNQKDQSSRIMKAISLGTLSISIATVLFSIKMVTPAFIVVFWLSSSLLTLAGRFLLRKVTGWMRAHGQNLRYLLIVGTNEKAEAISRTMEAKPELGYQMVGFVAEDPSYRDSPGRLRTRVVATIEELPSFLRNHVIDEVVVCLPIDRYYQEIASIVSACELHGLVVRIVSDLFDLRLARSKVEEYEGETAITVYTGDMEGWPVVVKRILDVFLSLFALCVFSPVFILASLLVKLGPPGPVFFSQERVGLSKRTFRMYKFRTMVADAEAMLPGVRHLNEVEGPAFKITDDPRVTAAGRYLRRTKIDEIPQLINVLKGDMSLVGPRPLTVSDYEEFSEDWQRRRFSVRPGITCLWQVGGQHAMSFKRWMELDMEYIDCWSLWLDLKILMRTIPVMLRAR
jgi:exopolysaccharide biosynthesis polyprenyl glycosylphosphotransferase